MENRKKKVGEFPETQNILFTKLTIRSIKSGEGLTPSCVWSVCAPPGVVGMLPWDGGSLFCLLLMIIVTFRADPVLNTLSKSAHLCVNS